MLLNVFDKPTINLTPHQRPFFPTDHIIQITSNAVDADVILGDRATYPKIARNPELLKKAVFFANDDDPSYLYNESSSIKFIAQPTINSQELTSRNALCVPLVMTDHVAIHSNEELLKQYRSSNKTINHFFAGQMYGERSKLNRLKLNNSIVRTTKTIYTLPDDQKLIEISKFLQELSTARFGFCPRGVGTSSFRLFECLMVGTVPIATDVAIYPFENLVDWDSFCIRGSMRDIKELVFKAESCDYDKMRANGIEFWERYCKMKNLYTNLVDHINAKL